MWFHLLPDSRALSLSKGVFHQKPLPNPIVPKGYGDGQA